MPTFTGVLEAAKRIAPHLPRTPMFPSARLGRMVGAEIWVKHENHQPTGAFKVRGGVNLIGQLPSDQRERGVIAASTGNHGQSVAFGARLFGVKARVCVPEGANPGKVQAMEDLGAEVIFHGADFDEAREHCERLAAEHDHRYIHSGNEPHLVEGVGTYALEMLEDEPRLDAIVVPIGGGSGAAGVCLVVKTIAPHVEVIGVQAEAAPAAYLSWKQGSIVTDRMGTAAEGLATRVGFELPQQILREHLDDFVLVSEDAIADATRMMIETTRNLVEGAAAATLAGALQIKDRLAGKRLGLVCSGGNISVPQLRELFSETTDPGGQR